MELNIYQWLTELSLNNHLGFAVFTVLVTGSAGALMAAAMELFLKLIGRDTYKIEPRH